MGVKGFGRRSGRSWRNRRERTSFPHLSSKIPHVCRARSVGWRSRCWNPLMRRRLGWASLLGWFWLLNHSLLQLLLYILLSSSLSSSSLFASSSQSPSTTLLLRKSFVLLLLVLKLRGLVTCRFDRAEFSGSLLVRPGHTCTLVGFPRRSHGEGDPFRI